MERHVKILGTGKYLPGKRVSARDMDERLGVPAGWTRAKTGVLSRYYADGETASGMGARAGRAALDKAGLAFKDIDCIICASATAEQEIPCTAVFVQHELGGGDSGIPAFDVNASCLSFVTALDIVSYMIEAGRFERVLIVSSDISSVALDAKDKESCSIFGDGAAAVVVGRTPAGEKAGIVGSRMETYSRGARFSELRTGGSRAHCRRYSPETRSDFNFHMDGRKLYKMSARVVPDLLAALLTSIQGRIGDLDMVIPHQASLPAMTLMQKHLGIADGKFMHIIQDCGNTVAASIPMALHEAIAQHKISRGDRIMLLGVAAGLSAGAMILDY